MNHWIHTQTSVVQPMLLFSTQEKISLEHYIQTQSRISLFVVAFKIFIMYVGLFFVVAFDQEGIGNGGFDSCARAVIYFGFVTCEG